MRTPKAKKQQHHSTAKSEGIPTQYNKFKISNRKARFIYIRTLLKKNGSGVARLIQIIFCYVFSFLPLKIEKEILLLTCRRLSSSQRWQTFIIRTLFSFFDNLFYWIVVTITGHVRTVLTFAFANQVPTPLAGWQEATLAQGKVGLHRVCGISSRKHFEHNRIFRNNLTTTHATQIQIEKMILLFGNILSIAIVLHILESICLTSQFLRISLSLISG